MRKIAVLILGLMVAACAQAVVDVPRDVYGAAAQGTLPPEVPKGLQVRYSDEIWKKSVAACAAKQEKPAGQFSAAEAGRLCACTFDLMQTRVSAVKLAQSGMDAQGGKQVSPRDYPEVVAITLACWPK